MERNEGYVEIPAQDALRLCETKERWLLAQAEAKEAEEFEKFVKRLREPRRVWYAPWKFHPPLSDEEIRRRWEEPQSVDWEDWIIPLPSCRDEVFIPFNRRLTRVRMVKEAAREVDTMLLSIHTYNWLHAR